MKTSKELSQDDNCNDKKLQKKEKISKLSFSIIIFFIVMSTIMMSSCWPFYRYSDGHERRGHQHENNDHHDENHGHHDK
ncbi:MAG: hypothetical protein NTW49_06035 [Bacteroidia bacterium]|nr:hypothetical protein [Bacteroidia bacterium]